MFLGNLHPVAGPRYGTETWVRRASGGNLPHRGGRIFVGAGHGAGRAGAIEEGRQVRVLPDSPRASALEFSANQRAAGARKENSPRREIQRDAFAVKAGPCRTPAGGHYASRHRRGAAAEPARFQPVKKAERHRRGGGPSIVTA